MSKSKLFAQIFVWDKKTWFCVAGGEGHAPPNLRHEARGPHNANRASAKPQFCVAGWEGHALPLLRHKTMVLSRKSSGPNSFDTYAMPGALVWGDLHHLMRLSVWEGSGPKIEGSGTNLKKVKSMVQEQLRFVLRAHPGALGRSPRSLGSSGRSRG